MEEARDQKEVGDEEATMVAGQRGDGSPAARRRLRERRHQHHQRHRRRHNGRHG